MATRAVVDLAGGDLVAVHDNLSMEQRLAGEEKTAREGWEARVGGGKSAGEERLRVGRHSQRCRSSPRGYRAG